MALGYLLGEVAYFADSHWGCRADSIRTGFMLAQGGEFAFVLLSLAKELKVLPDELNRLLIIVVVLSMALTPALADLGEFVAEKATGVGGGSLFAFSCHSRAAKPF